MAGDYTACPRTSVGAHPVHDRGAALFPLRWLSRTGCAPTNSSAVADGAISRVEPMAVSWLSSRHAPPPVTPSASLPRPVCAGSVRVAGAGQPGMGAARGLLRVDGGVDGHVDAACAGSRRCACDDDGSRRLLRACHGHRAAVVMGADGSGRARQPGLVGAPRDGAPAGVRTALAAAGRLILRLMQGAGSSADSTRPPGGHD